jgi:hypothetical protein
MVIVSITKEAEVGVATEVEDSIVTRTAVELSEDLGIRTADETTASTLGEGRYAAELIKSTIDFTVVVSMLDSSGLSDMVAVSSSTEDAEAVSEIKLDVSDTFESWLDTDRTVVVSITDEIAAVVSELEGSIVVDAAGELSNRVPKDRIVDDSTASTTVEGWSDVELDRSVTSVSVAADAIVSLTNATSDAAEIDVELSKGTSVVSLTTSAGVSETDDVVSNSVLVVFSVGVSIAEVTLSVVVIGTILVVEESKLVEELMKELDEDDALHLPLTSISAFLGRVSFCGGRVNVHSLRALMFFTPRRETRRYALA